MSDGGPKFAGSRLFYDHAGPSDRGNAKIYLPVLVSELALQVLGMVDTGADWSVLEWRIAEALGLPSRAGTSLSILTRLGRFEGTLERVSIELTADSGRSLQVEATFFVSPDWGAGTFLGYNGLLQHLRFAVDANHNRFYFGV